MDLGRYDSRAQTIFVASKEKAQTLGHQAIDPEHLLFALLKDEAIQKFCDKTLGTQPGRMLDKLELALGKLPKSSAKAQFLSPRLMKVASAAEAVSIALSSKKVGPAHLLIALASTDVSDGAASQILKDGGITRQKVEQGLKGRIKLATAPTKPGEQSILEQFTIDLTAKARNSQIGPIIGRDDEIRRVIQNLSRFSKNNPLLVGHSGIGRRSIVEGLALRIANDDVPAGLKNKRILTIDMSSLVAGSSLRGQFEERIKTLVNEVKGDGSIILFINDIHTLVGAGGDGASDASNMLKPALSRGEIQVLGATTPEEYKKSIEKDKDLERRFQTIQVEEPSVDETIRILRGIKGRFEVHHGVRIQDSALVAATNLSKRYMPSRRLPDKAIDLIDEAASRLKVVIDSVPDELDNRERTLSNLKMELISLQDEKDQEAETHKAKIVEKIATIEGEIKNIRARWEKEVDLIQTIRALKKELVSAKRDFDEAERAGDTEKAAELKFVVLGGLEDKLNESTNQLNELQKTGCLIKEEVGPEDIAGVIGDITGIPVASMLEGEKAKLNAMEERLGERVIGQKQAIVAISEAVRRSRAGLNDPNRPTGSFCMLGPSGVGKTELAKALAQFLFNNEQSLIRLDMSEFMEKHTVARLIGSPPGYKGSDEGGQLTEAVRRKPYSVVLFDEIEKAHPDIFNILLQILDDGRLSDSTGQLVDFKNTVIIMTSNVGSKVLLDSTTDNGHITEAAKDTVMAIMKSQFRPEFLGRIDATIMFHGLTKENMDKIADLQLGSIRKMLLAKGMTINFTDEAKKHLIDIGYDPAFGARPLRKAIQNLVQNPLSNLILKDEIVNGDAIVAKLEEGSLQFVKQAKT